VARFIHVEYVLDPAVHLVTGGPHGLVQVDDRLVQVFLHRPLFWFTPVIRVGFSGGLMEKFSHEYPLKLGIS
jgi:hypothetical protein